MIMDKKLLHDSPDWIQFINIFLIELWEDFDWSGHFGKVLLEKSVLVISSVYVACKIYSFFFFLLWW